VQNFAFTSKCLAVKSGSAFTLTLDNTTKSLPDGHNVSIYSSPGGQGELFHGDVVSPGSVHTFHVGALARGIYYFRCDIHPEVMKGLFVVK
jgi:plastocyanin